MTVCRKTNRALTLAAAAGLCLAGTGVALAGGTAGYVTDASGHYVRDGSGHCVRTPFWRKADANAECDPGLMAKKSAPVPMAALEAPKPAPKPQLKAITLGADAYFGFNRATLNAAGKQKLNKIAATLKKGVKEPRIDITGYTDRIGSAAYNEKLSLRRAQAVKAYLVSRGIPAAYITVKGAGASSPVVSCTGKRGKTLIHCLAPNRRTVVDFSAFEEVK